MSYVFDVDAVVIKTLVNDAWVRVGYISEVNTNALPTQEWTLLEGFDPGVARPMQFSQATPVDIREVNASARISGKLVVTSYSQDFLAPPPGADNPAIELEWVVRATRILNAAFPNGPFDLQGGALATIKQISPNFKPAPDQDNSKPWLKVIQFDYQQRPFVAEVWNAGGVELSLGGVFEIKACDTCKPTYRPGRYTLMVAPA